MTRPRHPQPATLLLVPGFMSPAWMMYPIYRYLHRDFAQVIRWDYPHVFHDTSSVIDSLAEQMDRSNTPISIVAHSFGDWITRSALHRTTHKNFGRLVSVCPVTSSVPILRATHGLASNLTEEFAVMSSDQRAGVSIPDHLSISRSIVWATGDAFVDDESNDPHVIRERRVWATHNSVLFQPNAWQVIRQELLQTDFGTSIALSKSGLTNRLPGNAANMSPMTKTTASDQQQRQEKER
ncbi:esterase/lipase family protein [Aporhodopirellula aestuarii]|uniref:Alpha/beta hydrolase n=1 Tax=Aporhodopirellula aestuarii TaxID=2950107 RepID=A0ABT0UAW0_9BACT|nr:hypothetical protein [Aporhodopirellula aestuarii]MCM2373660.1 hypothetical protein [Aporhodopirellula aestuarii]